jgi:hypothetical protein
VQPWLPSVVLFGLSLVGGETQGIDWEHMLPDALGPLEMPVSPFS